MGLVDSFSSCISSLPSKTKQKELVANFILLLINYCITCLVYLISRRSINA